MENKSEENKNKETETLNAKPKIHADAAIRITMMPRDTNAHGTVFGGIILSYIDVAGGVEAVRHTHHDRFVTVAMREIIFLQPVFIGDLVSFYAETVKVGSTSITIKVVVEAERFGNHGQTVRVTEADVTYVAINQYREKVKIGK
ncbi:MAG TPA: hotdog domain-containing protein [Pyrinomonadaceae bacterium]|nr:hotdog domain-containing protein [Pyrinomonadaceae bacterium]